MQGKLRGCFALTELGLGVLSGSTVRTRLLDAPGGGFSLHNIDSAAAVKVWISCGKIAPRRIKETGASFSRLETENFNKHFRFSSPSRLQLQTLS